MRSGVKLKKIKVNSQLRIKVHKFETNNQNKRDVNLRVLLKFGGVELHKIKGLKSIKSTIRTIIN